MIQKRKLTALGKAFNFNIAADLVLLSIVSFLTMYKYALLNNSLAG